MGPWQHGCEGNIPGSETESERRCTGWGASRDGIPSSLSCGNSAYDLRLDRRSRMRRESHVRFCEGAGGQFPRATRLLMGFEHMDDAQRVMEVLPKRMGKYGLTLHPDKTRLFSFEVSGEPQDWIAICGCTRPSSTVAGRSMVSPAKSHCCRRTPWMRSIHPTARACAKLGSDLSAISRITARRPLVACRHQFDRCPQIHLTTPFAAVVWPPRPDCDI